MDFNFYCSGLKEAIGSDNARDEVKKRFDDFCGQILNFDNLVILAGSGTSLSFNQQCQDNNWIAPSMWHLWDLCSKIDSFEEVKRISQYEYHAPKSENEQTKEDVELLLSLIDQQLVFGTSSEKDLLQVFKSEAIKEIVIPPFHTSFKSRG